MRGRGAALLIGMRAGEARAQQAQAQQQQAQAAQQQAYEQGKQEAAGAPQAPAPAPAPAPASAPTPAAGSDLTAQLQSLANLHSSGVLTDEEYAAAKKKLLNI
jgi:hypothetical protein